MRIRLALIALLCLLCAGDDLDTVRVEAVGLSLHIPRGWGYATAKMTEDDRVETVVRLYPDGPTARRMQTKDLQLWNATLYNREFLIFGPSSYFKRNMSAYSWAVANMGKVQYGWGPGAWYLYEEKGVVEGDTYWLGLTGRRAGPWDRPPHAELAMVLRVFDNQAVRLAGTQVGVPSPEERALLEEIVQSVTVPEGAAIGDFPLF